MIDTAEARLQRLLGGDNLSPLRKRLRRRFERAPLDGTVDLIRVDKLTFEEHATLASLVGRPCRYSSSMQINVGLVDSLLKQAGIASSLHNALERLDGPIVHLAKAHLREQTAWCAIVDRCQHPDLSRLLRTPKGLSLIKRISRQDPSAALQFCRRTEAVLQHLPANGMTRSQLAADTIGDAHGLDEGQAVTKVVLAVLRQNSLPNGSNGNGYEASEDDSSSTQAREAERDRDTWAKVGVLVNELARPALFLNLPTTNTESYGAPLGEPAYASLRSLLRTSPPWRMADCRIYVCENPNLVAIAADHLGARCAPLVCTEGMPGAAQRCLLSQLTQAGARLLYHGDFDWPGIRIGNHVMRTHGALSWRFSAADYVAATEMLSGQGHPLVGNVTEALWDKDLTTIMQKRRIAIPEEALASSLLQDLNRE